MNVLERQIEILRSEKARTTDENLQLNMQVTVLFFPPNFEFEY